METQPSCSHYNPFCTITWLTRISLRTWQHQMTTIMQPFHCNLQPQIQKTHGTTHTGTTTRNTEEEHIRDRNDRSRTRRTHEVPFIAACSHFTQKINGFVLRLPPQHKPRATSIQPLQCVLQHHVANPHLSTHMATPNNKIMQPFHSDLQPQIQKTHGTTHTGTTTRNTEEEHIRDRNDRSRTRRTHEVPFIATCSHFTQKNKRFCAPASSPTQTPCNIHTAITMLFAASRGEPASLYAHGNTK